MWQQITWNLSSFVLQKSVLAFHLPLIKILSEVPYICLGRYVDKIISSLLAYVSLVCLFIGRINVAYNLQLVFILLMTGSHKMSYIQIWKVMALIRYTDAQTQIWKRKPNQYILLIKRKSFDSITRIFCNWLPI